MAFTQQITVDGVTIIFYTGTKEANLWRETMNPVLPTFNPQPFQPEMILIPAEEFLMGSDPQLDPFARDEEQPQHVLYLPDYYLAKTPVTNVQYDVFVKATGHKPPSQWQISNFMDRFNDHPVVDISWYDALTYCTWLTEATGKTYYLPSEAEWEKGARGTDGRIYPWGNQYRDMCSNSEEIGEGITTSVGSYPNGASPYGLLDMAGNVLEWTRSLCGRLNLKTVCEYSYPYRPADGREDLTAPWDVGRVLRGGAFAYDSEFIRCATRFLGFPLFARRQYLFGFRVAMSPI